MEWSERLVAELLGGQLADSPVQPHWDVRVGEEHVQVRYLANATGPWVNEHLVSSRPGVDAYALVVFEAFVPLAVLVFPNDLTAVCAALGKRHPKQESTLQFTRRNFLAIMKDKERYASLGVQVFDLVHTASTPLHGGASGDEISTAGPDVVPHGEAASEAPGLATVEVVAEKVVQMLGDPSGWDRPEGYPNSLALCIVESIQSIGVRYGSVERVVGRYRQYRRDQGDDPNIDGAPELLATFEELGGEKPWARRIGNKNRTHARAWAPRKAAVIEQAARSLSEMGICTASDLRAAVARGSEDVKATWLDLPSQRSGVSWHYLLMLAGIPGVKPDRMILRFLKKHLRATPNDISSGQAVSLLHDIAAALGVSTTVLDHRIWQFESGRRPRGR